MIISITFTLSYLLPINDVHTHISHLTGLAVLRYRFLKQKKKGEDNLLPEIYYTSILLDFIPDTPPAADIQIDIHHAVVNSMIYLNNFIDSFRLVSGMHHVRNFTIDDLPPYLHVKVNDDEVLYIMPDFAHMLEPTIGDKELSGKTVEKFETWRAFRPFEVIDKFHSKAIYHLHSEEFVFAIVEMQTSFEAYIRLCHRLIMEAGGADESEIESKMAMPLKNAIEHHLGKAFGTDLSAKANPVMEKWQNSLYRLRNEIVHSGLSYINGNEAFDAYQESRNYLSGLLVANGFLPADKMVHVGDIHKRMAGDEAENTQLVEKLRSLGLLKFMPDP